MAATSHDVVGVLDDSVTKVRSYGICCANKRGCGENVSEPCSETLPRSSLPLERSFALEQGFSSGTRFYQLWNEVSDHWNEVLTWNASSSFQTSFEVL